MQGSLAEYGPDSNSKITGSMATDKCNLGISLEVTAVNKTVLCGFEPFQLVKNTMSCFKTFFDARPCNGILRGDVTRLYS